MFEIIAISIAILFFLFGIIGSILPILPGPILTYFGIVLLYFFTDIDVSFSSLILYLVLTLIIFFSDYFLQIIGIKKFGGGRYVVYTTILGTFLGIFFAPFGLILGPFLGAFIGSFIEFKSNNKALKTALITLVGFLFGTLLKLVYTIYVFYLMVNKLLYLML